MWQNVYFSFRSIATVLGLVLLLGDVGITTVRAQEPVSGRPLLDLEGNKVFSKQELLGVANKCVDEAIESTQKYEANYLDYCLHKMLSHMHEKGYLQAKLGKTLYEQTDSGAKATIPVEEGALYRVGEIKIEAARLFTPAQILEMINVKPGDIANGELLSKALYERLKEAYSNFGYIQYSVEITPRFHLKDCNNEGVADFDIEIDEGQQFRIRSIKFTGGDKATTDLMRREVMVHDGEIFNHDLWKQSVAKMNNTGLFDPIDIDKDVDYKGDQNTPLFDLIIHLKRTVPSSTNP
jgi:outer membrane protein insertion porin family